MKLRRMLAAAVCFAMIATSSATTSFVYAQEADGQITEAAAGDQTEAVSEKTEVVTEAETATEPEVSEAVVVDPVDEDVPVAVESEEVVVGEEADTKADGDQPDKDSDSFLVTPDDVTPGFSVENGELKYTGGSIADEAVLISATGNVKIPAGIFSSGAVLDGIKEVYFTKDSGTISIADNAFFSNTKIRHVDGVHVTSVGNNAFFGCTSLSGFDMNNVETFGTGAFTGTALRSADLTNATDIGASAFNNCSALSGIKWGTGITTIGDSAFANCSFSTLTIGNLYELDPEGIGSGAFANNKKLVSATLPYQLEVLPQSVFKGCDALTTVNLSETDDFGNKVGSMLRSVGASAFESCSALKEMKFGKNVVEVGSLAFSGCKELILISFYQPEGDVDIDDSAIEVKGKNDKKGVIKGRGGKVKDYFDKNLNNKGWTYAEVDLFTIKVTNPKGVTIKSSVSKAGEGEEVKLTVTPTSGNTLTEIKVNDVPLVKEKGKNLFSSAPDKQVFVFNMPGENVTITGLSQTIANVFQGTKYSWDFTPGSYGATDSNVLKFPKAGGSTIIKVFNKTTNSYIDLWNYALSSSDTSVATISEFGEISAVKKGSAVISLKPKASSAPTISVQADVAKSAEVETISFEQYLEENAGTKELKDAIILEPKSEFNKEDVYVVEFGVDDIAKSEHKFTPRFVATDSEGEELLINSDWTVTNSKVAKVATAKTNLNENTITIPKGTAGGETRIKVTTVNEDSGKQIEGGIIIRVLDPAPKMRVNSVQVNVAQPGGVALDCEKFMYGFTLIPSTLRVCTRKSVSGSYVYTDNNSGFSAMYKSSTGEIFLSVASVKNKYPEESRTTFSGNNGLYVVGNVRRDGSEDDVEFHMPIKEVVVVNSKPKVELTYSGKINLLYNDDYRDATGEPIRNLATIYLNIKNVKDVFIEDVQFVTTENYKRSKTEVPDDDELAANFEWAGVTTNSAGYHTGLYVKVKEGIDTDEDFAKDKNGKIISSGYLKLKLKGYNSVHFDQEVSIPCAYTLPKYSLTPAKVTTSTYFANPEYKVQIMDNGASPKRALEIYEGEEDSRELKEGIVLENDYSGTEPYGFFNEPEPAGSEPVLDAKGKRQYDKVTGKQLFNDYIKLSATGIPQKAKERFKFQMAGWRKPMTFDFSMTSTTSALKGSFTPSSLTMNKQAQGQSAKMEFKFNLGDAKAVACDPDEFDYSQSAKTIDAYQELLGAFEFQEEDYDENGKKIPAHLVVNLSSCDLDSIPKGSYSFTAYPEVMFGNNTVQAHERPAVKFKISIIDSKPKMTLKGSKFSLNTLYSGGGETASVATKVSNIAKNAKYELDESAFKDIHLVAVNPKKVPYGWYGEEQKADGTWITPAGSWKDKFEFVACEDDDKNATKLGVKLKAGVPVSTFSYDYYLYGLPFTVGDESISMDGPKEKIRITVSGHQKKEEVKFSTKNVFNQIIAAKFSPANDRVVVPGYEAVYNVSIKNLNGVIDAVEIQELNSRTGRYYDTSHFVVDNVDTDKKTVTLILDRENIPGGDDIDPLQTDKTYRLDLKYHIKERDGKEAGAEGATWEYKRIEITPKQVLPELKQINEKKTMYVGGPDDTFWVEVGKTTCQTAVLCNCADPDDDINTYKMTEYTKISDSASADIRRAFKIIEVRQYDEDDNPIFMTDTNGNYVLDKNKDKIPCAWICVQLVEPSILVNGKTYTIPIEVRYENQDKYTKGNIVNFKVTIVK